MKNLIQMRIFNNFIFNTVSFFKNYNLFLYKKILGKVLHLFEINNNGSIKYETHGLEMKAINYNWGYRCEIRKVNQLKLIVTVYEDPSLE